MKTYIPLWYARIISDSSIVKILHYVTGKTKSVPQRNLQLVLRVVRVKFSDYICNFKTSGQPMASRNNNNNNNNVE